MSDAYAKAMIERMAERKNGIKELREEITSLRDVLREIERIYYTEGKDANWRAAHMNRKAYDALNGTTGENP